MRRLRVVHILMIVNVFSITVSSLFSVLMLFSIIFNRRSEATLALAAAANVFLWVTLMSERASQHLLDQVMSELSNSREYEKRQQ